MMVETGEQRGARGRAHRGGGKSVVAQTAVGQLLKKIGMTADQFEVIESNEAFAAQAIAVNRGLGLDDAKVNPNGGAIALGHPLGCTGAKLTVQIIHELQRQGKQTGLVTMCIGGGMGAAGIVQLV